MGRASLRANSVSKRKLAARFDPTKVGACW